MKTTNKFITQIKHKSCAGFSLPEVMVGAGIAGLLAIVMSKMMTLNTSQIKKMEDKLGEQQMISTILSSLSDRDVCHQVFGKSGLSIGGSLDKLEYQNSKGGKVRLLSVGEKLGVNSHVTSLNIKNASDGTGIPSGGGQGMIQFEVGMQQIEKLADGSTQYKVFNQIVPIWVEATGPSGQITGCYLLSSSVSAANTLPICQSLGGTYNSTTNVCQFNSTQAASKAFVDSRLTLISNYFNATRNFDCPAGQFVKSISNTGVPTCATPVLANNNSNTNNSGNGPSNSINSANNTNTSACNANSIESKTFFAARYSNNCQAVNNSVKTRKCDNGSWSAWEGGNAAHIYELCENIVAMP